MSNDTVKSDLELMNTHKAMAIGKLLLDNVGEVVVGRLGWSVISIILQVERPDPVFEKLESIAANIQKLEGLIKETSLSQKVSDFNRAAREIRESTAERKLALSNDTASVPMLERFLEVDWRAPLSQLHSVFTADKESGAAVGDLTKSVVELYSERMIAAHTPVKTYVESLLSLSAYFVQHAGMHLASIEATLQHLIRRTEPQSQRERYQKQATSARERIARDIVEITDHIEKLHPEAFRLYARLWGKGQAERCQLLQPEPFRSLEADVRDNDTRSLYVVYEQQIDWEYFRHEFIVTSGTFSRDSWEIVPLSGSSQVRIRRTNDAARYLAGPVEPNSVYPYMNVWLALDEPGMTAWDVVPAQSPYLSFVREKKALDECKIRVSLQAPIDPARHTQHFRMVPAAQRSKPLGIRPEKTEGHGGILGLLPEGQFDDQVTAPRRIVATTGAEVWARAGRVRKVRFRYLLDNGSTYWAPAHGEQAGDAVFRFELAEKNGRRETLASVEYSVDEKGLKSLKFVGSEGTESETAGTPAAKLLRAGASADEPLTGEATIAGFYGWAATYKRLEEPLLTYLGIRWNLPEPRRTAMVGDLGGLPFDDLLCHTQPVRELAKLTFWGDSDRIYGVQAEYRVHAKAGTVVADLHGRKTGEMFEVTLAEDDYLARVECDMEDGLRGVRLTCSRSGPWQEPKVFGRRGGHYSLVADGHFFALFGRSGSWVDAIGFHDATERSTPMATPYFGGDGGAWFDDLVQAPEELQGLEKIEVWVAPGPDEAEIIRAVQVTYRTRSGKAWAAPVHGEPHDFDRKEIKLDPSQEVAMIEFFVHDRLHAMRFHVARRLEDGTLEARDKWVASPRFGGQDGNKHTAEGPFAGFFGRAGADIDGLGAYLRRS